jgi:hypothetical protein
LIKRYRDGAKGEPSVTKRARLNEHGLFAFVLFKVDTIGRATRTRNDTDWTPQSMQSLQEHD